MRGRVFQKNEILLPRSGCRDELAKDLDPAARCQDTGAQSVPGLMALEAGTVNRVQKNFRSLFMTRPLNIILDDAGMP